MSRAIGAAAHVRPPSSLRQQMEAAIERLIAALDAIDADPDLEPSGDDQDADGDLAEPDLGWTGTSTGWRGDDLDGDRVRDPFFADREVEHDGAEPDEADDEPDLDAEPGTWLEAQGLRRYDPTADEHLEEDDPHGGADEDDNGMADPEGMFEQLAGCWNGAEVK